MKNKKYINSKIFANVLIIIIFLFMTIFGVGCGKNQGDSSTNNEIHTITDYSGTRLTLARKPQRIVSMSISTDEILIDLVESNRIVGLSNIVDKPGISNVIAKAKAVKGRVHGGNVEYTVSLRPDLIIAPDFIPVALIQTLRDSGINVYLYRTPHTITEIKNCIKELAFVVGESEKAEILIAQMDEKLNIVKSKTSNIAFADQKRLIEFKSNGVYYMPNSSFSNICKAVSARDATQELTYDKNCFLSQEEIVRLNPDVFVLVDWNYDGKHDSNIRKQEILSNQSYQTTKAGKNKAVVILSGAKLLSLSHYIADAVVDVAKVIYPERFKE